MIRHVVLLSFKDENDPRIADIEKGLGALPAVIPEIRFYEFGRDKVRSERSADFALVSAFDDLEALQRYQTHPDHLKVLEIIKGAVSEIRAVDYEY